MKKYIFTIIILLFVSYSSFAQSAGLNFTLGFPSSEFKNNLKRTGIGINGNFLFWNPTPILPFSAGIDISYYNYGSETRREPFSLTIPDVTVDVDRTNNLVNFHAYFQIALPAGPIRPYVEALFGGSYFYTQTSIKSLGNEDKDVASNTNIDDWAWSYGGGGGFLISLFSDPTGQVGSVFLDLKVRYLFGSEAEYLKEGSVTINNGQVYYDVSKSKTDILSAHIGAVVYFNSLFN